jgi:poly(3-hydroxybutyrate) depolymerase
MINIAIGLPLSSADGGSGSVHGAWNGRILALGEGGYAGSVSPPTLATDLGFVGSDTDTGHSAGFGAGSFALNPDGTLNWGLIRDYGFNGIHYQAVWSKQLAEMYYGQRPEFSYFSGCSGGGRQAFQLAQTYPDDFDGLLAGSSAIDLDRAAPGLGWGQVVMKQEVGAPISLAKLTAVTQAAVQALSSVHHTKAAKAREPKNYAPSLYHAGSQGSFDPSHLGCWTLRAVGSSANLVNYISDEMRRDW